MNMKLVFTVLWLSIILFGGFFATEASAAGCTVNVLTDTGSGSGAIGDLRYCVNQTNTNVSADTINFTVRGVILLGSSLPVISDALTINGNGIITIDGQDQTDVVPFRIYSTISVDIKNLTVMRGRGENPEGGCIGIRDGATLNLTNVTVDNCTTTAESGGGIRSESSKLNIVNSHIINNHMIVGGSSGSGIFLDGGILTMSGSIVSNNSLPDIGPASGAGIEMVVSSARIENSTISNNTNGDYGAGINNNRGNLMMSNVTVSNNTGGAHAGGVANIGGNAVLRNCTIAGNSVTRFGGGIYNGGPATLILANTIVADNSAGLDGQDIFNFAGLTKSGVNIVETAVVNSGSIDGAGTILTTDPMLLPLGNYGGIITSQPLSLNSLARNAGINSEALDTIGAALITDLRGEGFPRFTEMTVDIGAFESSAPSSDFMISGRVLPANNRVLQSRVIVRLADLTSGEQRFVSSNPFGFYRFKNVPTGANVRIHIMAKNVNFAPQTLTVAGEINNLNFTAEP